MSPPVLVLGTWVNAMPPAIGKMQTTLLSSSSASYVYAISANKYNSRNDRPTELDFVCHVDGNQKSNDTDTTRRHLEQDSGECVEAETLGDKTAESSNTTRGASAAEPHCRPHVCLGVLVSLPELVPFEFGSLGAISVNQTADIERIHTLVPVLFSASRSMAMSRSLPFLKNRAVVGELGSNIQTTGTRTKLKPPMKRKIPW